MSQSSGRNRRNIQTNEPKKNNKENGLDNKCNKMKKTVNEVLIPSRSKRNKNNKKNTETTKTKEISLRIFDENKDDLAKHFFEFKNVEIENPINGNDINIITLLYSYKKDKKIESNKNIKFEENVSNQLEQNKVKPSKNDKNKCKENQCTIPSLLKKKRMNSNIIEKFSYKILDSKDESIIILKVIRNNSDEQTFAGSRIKIDGISNKINSIKMTESKKSSVNKKGKSKPKKKSNFKKPKEIQKKVQNNKISNIFKPKEVKEVKIASDPVFNETIEDIPPEIRQDNLQINSDPMQEVNLKMQNEQINKLKQHSEEINVNQHYPFVDILNISGNEDCFDDQDNRVILDYEFDLKNHLSIEVTEYDIVTVKDQNLLNDTIITFYLKYLENIFSKDGQKNIYCFNTHFFVYLQSEYNDDINVCLHNYKKLCKWGKYVNILECDYVAIPINQNNHWSLIMIVNPRSLKNVFGNVSSEVSETNSFPKIIYFDSFFPDNEYCMKVIKRFLVMEYHRKMENSFLCKGNMEFNEIITEIESKMKAYYPKVPNQNNTYDCGIYLLTYAELFFNNPDYILSQLDKSAENGNTFINWFEIYYIDKKREFIKNLIHYIADRNNKENKKKILFDHIRDNQNLFQEYYNISGNKVQNICQGEILLEKI